MRPLNAFDMKAHHEVASKYLAPTLGCTVKSIAISMDGYVGLVLQPKSKAKGKAPHIVLWFERDQEGNGPGWFQVQHTEEMQA